jgi:hypothetical protein
LAKQTIAINGGPRKNWNTGKLLRAALDGAESAGARLMTSCGTYQFDDYSRFYAPMFSEEHKRQHRESRFPADIKCAFDMGVRLAAGGR